MTADTGGKGVTIPASQRKYYSLKNKAKKTRDEAQAIEDDGAQQLLGQGKYYHYGNDIKGFTDMMQAIGKEYVSTAKKAKAGVQDAYANAYGKVMGVNDSSTTKSSKTKSKSNGKRGGNTGSTAKKSEKWVETDDSSDGVTTKTSYGSRTIHQNGDTIYDNKYYSKDNSVKTTKRGNQPTIGKNISKTSVSPYTKSDISVSAYDNAYKKTMSKKTSKGKGK